MDPEYPGSANCVLHLSGLRGSIGCCKAASCTRCTVAERLTSCCLLVVRMYGLLCLIAALPHILDPWNALPLTRKDRTSPCTLLEFLLLIYVSCFFSFESEAVPGTIPRGQNSPRCVRFGLYAEQMTASAFVAPRHLNKNAWLYRSRPAVAHQGFVRLSQLETRHS